MDLKGGTRRSICSNENYRDQSEILTNSGTNDEIFPFLIPETDEYATNDVRIVIDTCDHTIR